MTEITNSNNKVRDINYLSKDFNSYRENLIEYIKKYFPDQWQDFSDASGGMMLLELVAYMGDSLSYLMDKQVNECFIDRAFEPRNIFNLSQNLGYKPSFLTPSTANISVSATFEDSVSSAMIYKIKKGSTFSNLGNSTVTFQSTEDIDFSSERNRTTNQIGGGLTTYSISGVPVISGETRTFSFEAPTIPKPFLKINLPDSNITEILSVSSNDGYEWYQVNNLSQEIIFYGDENTTSTSAEANSILKYKKIPRRFVTEKSSNGLTSIVFGSGVSETEDYNIIPNPEDYVLPASLRGSVSGFSPSYVDSSNFLRTNTLGISPSNVNITVEYRVGGGFNHNVGSNTIKRVLNRNIVFNDPTAQSTYPQQITTSLDSIAVNNTEPASGGRERESLRSIKENSISFFNSQGRAVTLQDYQVRVLSMPNNFGKVFRAFARKDSVNLSGVELILMGINSNGNLSTLNNVIKNNVESYIKHFKSFSDSVKLTDGKIINIGVDFTIVPVNTVDPIEALLDGINIIRDKTRLSLTNFNDSIIVSDFITALQSSSKILTVPELKITNKSGTIESRVYSDEIFNIQSNTVNGVIRIPEDSLWEVKFPNSDIVGRLA
jgi:hypothetical protein